MTTAASEQYGHGTRPCYVRGCRRPECCAANYQYMSRIRLEYHRGQQRRIDSTQTRSHIDRLYAAGWSQAQIAREADVAHRVIGAVSRGQKTVAKQTALGVLSILIGPPPAERDVDATGTIRRVRALVAIGWPIAQIAPKVGLYPTGLATISRGVPHVRATTADRVAREYRRLSRTPGPSNRARNDARRKVWAPPAAWDDERLDDPTATPDWTGHCGTDRGWWTHSLQKIPTCPPCETAHDAWKAEHRQMPRSEYMAALQRARGAASNREAGLAEDGRELMRFGADYEQAAARLGVTRQHLQQALIRHPERLDTAA